MSLKDDVAKAWWKSLTIWGGIVAALPVLSEHFGVPELAGLPGDITTLSGAVIAIIGRIKAVRAVKLF